MIKHCALPEIKSWLRHCRRATIQTDWPGWSIRSWWCERSCRWRRSTESCSWGCWTVVWVSAECRYVRRPGESWRRSSVCPRCSWTHRVSRGCRNHSSPSAGVSTRSLPITTATLLVTQLAQLFYKNFHSRPNCLYTVFRLKTPTFVFLHNSQKK